MNKNCYVNKSWRQAALWQAGQHQAQQCQVDHHDKQLELPKIESWD
jgi:hypothetical protein